MNRVVSTSLVLTLVLSAASLWTGRGAEVAAVVQPRLHAASHVDVFANTAGATPAGESTMLPATWVPTLLEPARRDFFSPSAPQVAAPPVQAVPVIAVPVAPPSPPAPPMNYRFVGHMVTPEGQRLVYLGGQGEQTVAVKAGDRLEDGWTVDSIDAEGIHLLFPEGQQRAVISIPSAP